MASDVARSRELLLGETAGMITEDRTSYRSYDLP